MSITLVSGQTVGGRATALSATVTLPNNPTAGNLVVVGVAVAANVTITVADGNSNSFAATTSSPTAYANGGRAGIFYLENAPANASKSITVTISGASSQSIDIWAAEFSGTATTSVVETDAVHTTTGSGTAINSPNITTTSNGDLLVGVAFAGGTISAAGSPFTGIAAVEDGDYAEYYIQPAAGTQAMAFTQSPSSTWTSVLAAFRAAGAAPSAPVGGNLLLTAQAVSRSSYW